MLMERRKVRFDTHPCFKTLVAAGIRQPQSASGGKLQIVAAERA